MLTEFITSLIIGYSRQNPDKNKSLNKNGFESAEFNKNLHFVPANSKRETDRNYVFINDLSDPLLDRMEKSLSAENQIM